MVFLKSNIKPKWSWNRKQVEFNKREHKKTQYKPGHFKSTNYRDDLHGTIESACADTVEFKNRKRNPSRSSAVILKQNSFLALFDKYKCSNKDTWLVIRDNFTNETKQ